MSETPIAAAPATPRPLQARAIVTRRRLVDAAVGQLSDGGLNAVRTAAVARRAGVSQGALFRHFPTKADLLGAALTTLLDTLLMRFQTEMLSVAGPDVDVVRVGLDSLWGVYTDPSLYGAFELFLAARTDPALRAVTGPVLEAHVARQLDLARLLFPDAAQTHPRFEATVVGLLATLQGLAVGAAAWPLPVDSDAPGRPVELDFIQELARRELGAPIVSSLWESP